MTIDQFSPITELPMTEQAFHQAFAHHQAGKLQEAEKLYQAILQTTPNHPNANHNMGVLLVQMQQPAASLPYFNAALDADPARGQYWLSYIEALFQSGQVEVAREVLALARQSGLQGNDVEALAARLSGEQVDAAVLPKSYCPVCGGSQVSFLPLPEFYREMALLHGYAYFGKGEMISLKKYSCGRCGASDRERLYALWLDNQLARNVMNHSARVMHFAPEPALSNKLRHVFANYETADFGMEHVDYKVDIQKLSFADESYDFFICSHVLEHVESDDLAISELYRITRKGGLGILVAPVIVGLKKTLEEPSVKDEAGRWKLFGQNDHVRLYAHDDFVNKVKMHGFFVEELGEGFFGRNTFRSLGLKPTSVLYIVRK